jgi:hypothetical protein
MRLTLVILGLAASLASLSGRSVIDLSERRLDCNQESRRNIIGLRRVDVDLYRRVLERRRLYVHDCMAKWTQGIEHTGPVSAPISYAAAEDALGPVPASSKEPAPGALTRPVARA